MQHTEGQKKKKGQIFSGVGDRQWRKRNIFQEGQSHFPLFFTGVTNAFSR